MSQSRDRRGIVATSKDGRPRHNRVGAGRDRRSGVLAVLATIDLDPGVKAFRCAHTAHFADLRQHFRQEGLPGKSGIDGHHQNDIAKVQHVLDKGEGACRIEHRARLLAELANARQHAMQVHRRRWLGLC